MVKVALCVVATGRYTEFLPALLESAGKLFLPGEARAFVVFSDQEFTPPAMPGVDLYLFTVKHEPWPGATLHRYHHLHDQGLWFADKGFTHVFMIDADMVFVREVGEEILPEKPDGLTATIHFGFVNKPRRAWTYEDRPSSMAYVHPELGKRYYAGGFQGGARAGYMKACKRMAYAIDADAKKGIVARWHDESHWNRHLIGSPPPEVELPHEYCCPPSWRPDTQRICIVNKNNQEYHQ